MKEYNILDEIEETRNASIYAIRGIKFLRFSLFSVLLSLLVLPVFTELGYLFEHINDIVVFVLYIAPLVIAIILGIIGLYNLVLSYWTREKRSGHQKTNLPIFGFLVFSFLGLLAFIISIINANF